jgi:hypothetical protein
MRGFSRPDLEHFKPRWILRWKLRSLRPVRWSHAGGPPRLESLSPLAGQMPRRNFLSTLAAVPLFFFYNGLGSEPFAGLSGRRAMFVRRISGSGL